MPVKRTPADLLHRNDYLQRKGCTEERVRLILEVMEKMEPERHRGIQAFKWYWGFTEEGSLILKEIGVRLGVTTERARQLILKVERKIRCPFLWRATQETL